MFLDFNLFGRTWVHLHQDWNCQPGSSRTSSHEPYLGSISSAAGAHLRMGAVVILHHLSDVRCFAAANSSHVPRWQLSWCLDVRNSCAGVRGPLGLEVEDFETNKSMFDFAFVVSHRIYFDDMMHNMLECLCLLLAVNVFDSTLYEGTQGRRCPRPRSGVRSTDSLFTWVGQSSSSTWLGVYVVKS